MFHERNKEPSGNNLKDQQDRKIDGCLSDCRWHGRAGTVDTADGEARDITSFVSGSAARDEANKDMARTESLLQLPSKPTLTKLSMAGGENAAWFLRGAVEAEGVVWGQTSPL